MNVKSDRTQHGIYINYISLEIPYKKYILLYQIQKITIVTHGNRNVTGFPYEIFVWWERKRAPTEQ